MKKAMLILSLFTLAFSFQITPFNSGYEYLPMTEGSSIVYIEANTTGTWHPNGKLDVNTRINTGNKIRVSFSPHQSPGYMAIHQHWRYTHLPVIPPNYAGGLVYSPSLIGGRPCMAEVRNEGNVYMSPGECILTFDPIVNETFTVSTSNYNSLFQLLGSGTWTYKTIGFYENWGPFTDVVRTSLSESTGLRYNFVFMKAGWVTETINGEPQTCWFPGGLVDFWHANPNLGTPTTRPGQAFWARPCEI